MKSQRQSKNVQVRKPVQDVMDGSERWMNDYPTKDIEKRRTKKSLDENSKWSQHLRDKTPVAKQDRTLEDLLTSADVADNLEKDAVHATRNFRTFKEGNKPQRIQVTPGKWNTK